MIPSFIFYILAGLLVGWLSVAYVTGVIQVLGIIAAAVLIVLGIIDALRGRNIVA